MFSLRHALRGAFALGRKSAVGTVASKPVLPLPALQGSPANPGLAEAGRLMAGGNFAAGFVELSRLKAERVPLRNADYLRAICFLEEDQLDAAIEALKEEVRFFPDNELAAASLKRLQADKPFPRGGDQEFQALLGIIRPYTMVGEGRLLSLFTLAKQVCQEDLPGHFVECGVAAGGSSALLAAVVARYSRRPRRLFSFDSFEGMPTPSDQDTHRGQRADAAGWGAGTCAAPVESLREVCRKLGVEALVEPVRGFFAQTVPATRERIGPIAFLHMDGDWYESTQQVLGGLYHQVVPGGRIQIDDYGYWEGCQRAVEDFQREAGLEFKLHPIDGTGVWLEKSRQSDKSGALLSPAGQAEHPRLLNLGCGGHFHPAWINLDIVPAAPGVRQHDLRTRLPFKEGEMGAVYHSHVLEHLPHVQALPFLRECHRVLAPGGILRVVVPDLETIARLYLQYLEGSLAGNPQAAQRYDWIVLELLDQMVREQSGGEMLSYWQQNPMPMEEFVIQRCGSEVLRAIETLRQDKPKAAKPVFRGSPSPSKVAEFRASGEIHRWMYDRHSLSVLVNQAGFRQAKVCAPDESQIPAFNSYLLDINADGTTRKPDSLYLEAVKP
jgi:predicted SAM-dependent methyltransferase